jgi:hypothetical protein
LNLRNLAWLAVLFSLGGCRALPLAPPPAAVISAEELTSRLQARHREVQSFQAKGRLTFLSPERNYSGTGLLKGRAPTTLRVDVLDFLGRSLLSFASDGVEVQVLFPKEEKLFQGKATPGNLAALIPPAVTLPQVLRLLVGGLPLSMGAPDSFAYDPSQGDYLLEWHLSDGSLKERVWVKAQGLDPFKGEWYGDGGRLRFSVELADFGGPAPHLPGKITLRTETPKAELRLVYREMQVNPPLTAADLTLQPPPTVAVVPLEP